MWCVRDLNKEWSWFEGMTDEKFVQIVAEAEARFGEAIDLSLLKNQARLANHRLLHYEFYYS